MTPAGVASPCAAPAGAAPGSVTHSATTSATTSQRSAAHARRLMWRRPSCSTSVRGADIPFFLLSPSAARESTPPADPGGAGKSHALPSSARLVVGWAPGWEAHLEEAAVRAGGAVLRRGQRLVCDLLHPAEAPRRRGQHRRVLLCLRRRPSGLRESRRPPPGPGLQH